MVVREEECGWYVSSVGVGRESGCEKGDGRSACWGMSAGDVGGD